MTDKRFTEIRKAILTGCGSSEMYRELLDECLSLRAAKAVVAKAPEKKSAVRSFFQSTTLDD